jgi:hypothetical protein
MRATALRRVPLLPSEAFICLCLTDCIATIHQGFTKVVTGPFHNRSGFDNRSSNSPTPLSLFVLGYRFSFTFLMAARDRLAAMRVSSTSLPSQTLY